VKHKVCIKLKTNILKREGEKGQRVEQPTCHLQLPSSTTKIMGCIFWAKNLFFPTHLPNIIKIVINHQLVLKHCKITRKTKISRRKYQNGIHRLFKYVHKENSFSL
jgi:hypothetical protein